MPGGNDNKLIESLKKDDLKAFNALFKKYAEKLYAFVLSLTKQSYAAEEVTQLVFIKIWEKRSAINKTQSFKSFIFTITYNETISWLRKEASRKKWTEHFRQGHFDITNETNYEIEFNSFQSLVEKVIDKLPDKRKEIFKLSRQEGLSNKEVAEKLGISVRTVENQISSALKTLKNELGKKEAIGILLYFIHLV